jgi:hypothetical protein
LRPVFLNSRGYLGSIGDDLPSLIPITFALLVFFAALNFSFGQFDEKQTLFDQKLLTLKIASTIKGDSIINDYEQFKTACQTLSITGFKFRADLYSMMDDAGKPLPVRVFEETSGEHTAPVVVDKSGNAYRCPSTDTEQLKFASLASQRPEVLLYPVAVNFDGIIQPAMLVVTVWR